ncbi:MAG: DUF255 domain-containing protein [Bacteroidia bacterium]|nr:DUF255 domain-containing protein [Bacteroidia bacterium]MDW8301241.1 DUF255 domain-containing protein [Bacteroidia bacterium]
MRRYLLIAFILGLVSMGFMMYKTSGIDDKPLVRWYDFNEGLKVAKEQNKHIMIDVYTEWCGWCKKLDKITYRDKEVVEILEKDFIAIKLDPELPNVYYDYAGKQYTGKQLERKFKIKGYPTIIFMRPDGSVIDIVEGYFTPAEMVETLKIILKK